MADHVEYCGACIRCCDSMPNPFDKTGRTKWSQSRMVVCFICGNKRCPHATDHRNACTGSNERGQPGSIFGPPATPAAPSEPGTEELVRDHLRRMIEDGRIIKAAPSETVDDEQTDHYAAAQRARAQRDAEEDACSDILLSHDEWSRFLDWCKDDKRKPAALAFTSGPLRTTADLVEPYLKPSDCQKAAANLSDPEMCRQLLGQLEEPIVDASEPQPDPAMEQASREATKRCEVCGGTGIAEVSECGVIWHEPCRYCEDGSATPAAPSEPAPAAEQGRELPDGPGMWNRSGQWAFVAYRPVPDGCWNYSRQLLAWMFTEDSVKEGMRIYAEDFPRGNWHKAQSAPADKPAQTVEGRDTLDASCPADEPREIQLWRVIQRWHKPESAAYRAAEEIIEDWKAQAAPPSEEIGRLREFKRLVHDGLDSLGVPACYDAHVQCRIGERLKRLAAERARLRAENEQAKATIKRLTLQHADFRGKLRDALSKAGVESNPGWEDGDIVAAFEKLRLLNQ